MPLHLFLSLTIPVLLLALLSLAGFFGTWVLSSQNGTFTIILDRVAQGDILATYTGIQVVDRQLSILVAFFLPALDSLSNGDLALFSIFGLGQFGKSYVILKQNLVHRSRELGAILKI